MRREHKKKLGAQELRTAGLTPELVTRRVRPKEEFRRFVVSIAGAGDSNANEKEEEVAPRAKRRRS